MGKNRIAVFASGRGSNFKNILDKTLNGYIPAKIELLVTDKYDTGASNIAQINQIAVKVFSPKEFPSKVELNKQMLKDLIEHRITHIVLAGYLKLIGAEIVRRFENKILNIHPALLPSFGGKGMYGSYVHQAVFEHGTKVSGVTVHLVNEKYDTGPIVLQKCVDISDLQSAEEIAQKVLHIEHEIYPTAVKLLVEDKLKITNRRVEILGD
jgi:formyltetrahydrofolate-dependent phosphoribosylglycinamide formyltransferase